MKKRKYIILWIVCAFVLVGLAISYPFFRNRILGGDEEKPYHYERRSVMRTIETGCRYLFGRRGGVCQLTNYDGSPYLANGWRDIG